MVLRGHARLSRKLRGCAMLQAVCRRRSAAAGQGGGAVARRGRSGYRACPEQLFPTKASDQGLLPLKATAGANEVLGAAGLQAAGSLTKEARPGLEEKIYNAVQMV